MAKLTPKQALDLAKEKKATYVDLKFMDFVGIWQHFSIPLYELTEDVFEEGLGFDGSSIRGWQAIHASDMLVVPDSETAVIDPFMAEPTLSLICNVVDPITKEPYSRDPRNIAIKAEKYLKSTGIGDTAFFGPEAEFFIFDEVRYDTGVNHGFYKVDSVEGQWNTGREEAGGNLGYKPRYKEGYFPVAPDRQPAGHPHRDVPRDGVGRHPRRAAAPRGRDRRPGRDRHQVRARSSAMADNLQWFKYIIKNVARRHGKTVTFMPKPLYGDNGSGMHVHQSIWKDGKPLFAGDGYAGLSDLAMWYIGGILKHGPALAALCCPTTNSYKRLVPGFEAPINLAYSARNRSASIRIPMYSPSPKAKRIEFRSPDPSANGYLAFAAMLMAGLDGIENKLNPGQPLDKDIYGMSPEELKEIPKMPGSLDEALECLRRDHKFLLKGDVFTEDVIETWIQYKYDKEVNPVRMRPSPMEYALYFDI